MYFSTILVILAMFLNSSHGKPFQTNDAELEWLSNDTEAKHFHLPEEDFLTICCCIALFIVVAVFVIFVLIFYGESKEFQKQNERPTPMSESRTYLCSTKSTHQKSLNRSSELTPSKLETIPELQSETVMEEKC